jgi:hypothetical protein
VFTTAPYNLPWGSSIYVIIVAVNIKGNSVVSEVGFGGVILSIPDAPINLVNVASLTTATSIGLTWTNGTSNGGSAIIDYRVSFN